MSTRPPSNPAPSPVGSSSERSMSGKGSRKESTAVTTGVSGSSSSSSGTSGSSSKRSGWRSFLPSSRPSTTTRTSDSTQEVKMDDEALMKTDTRRSLSSKDIKKIQLYALRLKNENDKLKDELQIRADTIEQLEENLKTMSESSRTMTNLAMKQEVQITELREALALKEKHLSFYKDKPTTSIISTITLPVHLRKQFNIFLQQLLSYQRGHFAKALANFVNHIEEKGLPKDVKREMLLQEMMKIGNEMTEDYVSELELRINGAFGGAKDAVSAPPGRGGASSAAARTGSISADGRLQSPAPSGIMTGATPPPRSPAGTSAEARAFHRVTHSGDGVISPRTSGRGGSAMKVATGVPADLVRQSSSRRGMSLTPTGGSTGMMHPAAGIYGIHSSRTSLARVSQTLGVHGGAREIGKGGSLLDRIQSGQAMHDTEHSVSFSGSRAEPSIVHHESDEEDGGSSAKAKKGSSSDGTGDGSGAAGSADGSTAGDKSGADSGSKDAEDDDDAGSRTPSGSESDEDPEAAAMKAQMLSMVSPAGAMGAGSHVNFTSPTMRKSEDESSEDDEDDEDGGVELDLEDIETREMMAQMMEMVQESGGAGGSDGMDQIWTSFMSFKQTMDHAPSAEKVYKVEDDGFGHIALRDMLDALPSEIATAVFMEQTKYPTEVIRDVLIQRGCWPIIRFSGDRYAALTVAVDFDEIMTGLCQYLGLKASRKLIGILDPQHTTGFRLHQVTGVVRNRNEAMHDITALNFRVGRLWTPKSKMIRDAIDFWSNLDKPACMLLLGPNTAEKAALTRQIARMISERVRTALVDTRCAVAGYGSAPIECGSAVRFYVNNVATQKNIIDQTRSIYPKVVIVDEVLSTDDIEAVTKLQSEGISVIVGTNMNDLKSLLMHPVFCKLLPPQDRLGYKAPTIGKSLDRAGRHRHDMVTASFADESIHLMSPHLVVLQINYNANKLTVFKNIPSAVEAIRQKQEPSGDSSKLNWGEFDTMGHVSGGSGHHSRGMSMGMNMLLGQIAMMNRDSTDHRKGLSASAGSVSSYSALPPGFDLEDEISITDFRDDGLVSPEQSKYL